MKVRLDEAILVLASEITAGVTAVVDSVLQVRFLLAPLEGLRVALDYLLPGAEREWIAVQVSFEDIAPQIMVASQPKALSQHRVTSERKYTKPDDRSSKATDTQKRSSDLNAARDQIYPDLPSRPVVVEPHKSEAYTIAVQVYPAQLQSQLQLQSRS